MVALLTDFGIADNYTGIVKGIIKGISPETDIVDITHSVEPFSILNGQYLLYSAYRYFPPGTLFYAVVDPGVGTSRRALIADTGDYLFTAPDNGLLSPFSDSLRKIYEIDMGLFPGASDTFHGRDIFAPVVAGLASGKKPEDFGRETEEMVKESFPGYTPGKGFIEGRVLHLDRFGNVITSIPSSAVDLQTLNKILVSCKSGDFPAAYAATYGDLSGENAGIIYGSSGFIELCMNMKPLSEERKIRIEEGIRIVYE
jgi:S-adenosyl-L-methionine hydrolase (adenosine-forming)